MEQNNFIFRISEKYNIANVYNMVSLNNNKLFLSILGAVGVILGVIMKNSTEQMKIPDHPVGSQLGPLLFALGWGITAYAISMDNNFGVNWMSQKTMMAFAASAGVFMAVMRMKKLMKEGKEPGMLLPGIFVGGWLLLANAIGNRYSWAGASMVLLGMMVALPWQRKACIVDGVGMPLFTAGWAAVVFGNSL